MGLKIRTSPRQQSQVFTLLRVVEKFAKLVKRTSQVHLLSLELLVKAVTNALTSTK